MSKEKKEKPQFNINADSSQLRELIRQASDCNTKIDIQKDEIKAARQTAKETLGVEPATFNTLLRWYHKREKDADEAKIGEASDIYDKVFNNLGVSATDDEGDDV
jgi:hypothetical protein